MEQGCRVIAKGRDAGSDATVILEFPSLSSVSQSVVHKENQGE